jgi:hypothetical protein
MKNTEKINFEKNQKLIANTIKVVMEVLGENFKMGECYTESSTCFILGNHLYKTPIEIHLDDTKTMLNVLFFDTLDKMNWSMIMRKPYNSYFCVNGQFYTACEDNADMAVEVSNKQVLDEVRSACKKFKDFAAIEKALDSGCSVFEAMKK